MTSAPTVVVFDRAALDRLADPAGAIADARTWSDGVGVYAADRERARRFLDGAGADPDFLTGAAGLQTSLGVVRQRNPGDRHVLIGVDDEDARETATAVAWDYLAVEKAAREADWALE